MSEVEVDAQPEMPGEPHTGSPHDLPTTHTRGRLWRLCRKELRETLRDHRTILTLLLTPLLVYPLLSLITNMFLLSVSPPGAEQIVIGTANERHGQMIRQSLDAGLQAVLREEALLQRLRQSRRGDGPPESEPAGEAAEPAGEPAGQPAAPRGAGSGPETRASQEDAAQAVGTSRVGELEVLPIDVLALPESVDLRAEVAQGALDLAIFVRPAEAGYQQRLEIVHRPDSSQSREALQVVKRRFEALNQTYFQQRLRRAGAVDATPLLVDPVATDTPADGGGGGFSALAFVPLMLILMTITGAVYPAIDLTAGERERGTLEMLVASPIPRMSLLFSKYVAVVSVAMLTAVINLLAMAITLYSTGLAPLLFGGGGLPWLAIVQMFGLLILFAAFFSAILLALTSMARSFKEAQAYLIPLMLLSIAPGVICLAPGLKFNALLAVTPLMNMVILGRDLMAGQADYALALVAVAATAIYAFAALAVAASTFGSDAMLQGSQLRWSDLLARSPRPLGGFGVSGVLLTLAIVFPLYFVAANWLGTLRELPLSVRLVGAALVTAGVFVCFPLALALYHRVRLVSGFRLHAAPLASYVPAILIGLMLWPIVYEIVLLPSVLQRQLPDAVRQRVFGDDGGEAEALKRKEAEKLAAALAALPLWLVLLSQAATPAICEELFFRGFLFRGLLQRFDPRTTIGFSAVLFGLFHVLVGSSLAPERFVPSTLIGLALGVVAYRSGSVWPPIVLHTLHNGFQLTLNHYRETVQGWGWDLADAEHLPLGVLLTSLVVLLVAGGLLALVSPRPPADGAAAPAGA